MFLFEGRSILGPAQWVLGSERVNTPYSANVKPNMSPFHTLTPSTKYSAEIELS